MGPTLIPVSAGLGHVYYLQVSEDTGGPRWHCAGTLHPGVSVRVYPLTMGPPGAGDMRPHATAPGTVSPRPYSPHVHMWLCLPLLEQGGISVVTGPSISDDAHSQSVALVLDASGSWRAEVGPQSGGRSSAVSGTGMGRGWTAQQLAQPPPCRQVALLDLPSVSCNEGLYLGMSKGGTGMDSQSQEGAA